MKMNTRYHSRRLGSVLLGVSAFAAQAQTPATIDIDLSAEGPAISPVLYGAFFEDINFGADGGLYAELIQNRSFEYYSFRPMGLAMGERPLDYHPFTAWEVVMRGGNANEGDRRRRGGRVHFEQPIDLRNPHYFAVRLPGDGTEMGLANTGYDGITVTGGTAYNASLFARALDGDTGPIRVALETADGEVLAEAQLPTPGDQWQKLQATLKPSRGASGLRFVVTAKGAGELSVDMVSLMPADTFMGRENGLRKDLAQAIADLKPKTLRFPGGCIVHGNGLDEAYRWKDSVGPLETRRGNSNRWGYHQTYGLGYFEYFLLAEDIGAEPLPILPVGVSCGFEPPYEVARPDELDEWIDDVIDLVEFANGPADSEWGGVRAAMGHPEPFNLKYIGLGNEEHDTALFREYYPRFVEALREAHPEITIIGTSGLSPNIPAYGFMAELDIPIADEHYYERPEWFIDNRNRFDGFDRSGPKVYVGEYASRGNTLFNGLAEAVYLTGIERNADMVVMTAYAPLLARYGHTQWTQADLIFFDDKQVVLTPNYHVQKLFSEHAGDRYVPSDVQVGSGGGDAPLLAVSCTAEDNGTVHIKLVNPTQTAMNASIRLSNAGDIEAQASRTLLTGEPDAANSRETPNRVAPTTAPIQAGERFEVEVPAMSLQVITLKTGG